MTAEASGTQQKIEDAAAEFSDCREMDEKKSFEFDSDVDDC